MYYPHVCAVCGKHEIPLAGYYESQIFTTDFWLCPKCHETLRQMIKERQKCSTSNP